MNISDHFQFWIMASLTGLCALIGLAQLVVTLLGRSDALNFAGTDYKKMGNLILLFCFAICLIGLIWIVQYQSYNTIGVSGKVISSTGGGNDVSVVSSVSNSTGFTHVSGVGNRIELVGQNNNISLVVSNEARAIGYMRLIGTNIHKVIPISYGQDVSLDLKGNGNTISVDASLKPHLTITGNQGENYLEFK